MHTIHKILASLARFQAPGEDPEPSSAKTADVEMEGSTRRMKAF